MGNSQSLPPREENDIECFKWVNGIFKELCFQDNENPTEVINIMDKFLEKFREYIHRKDGRGTKLQDLHLATETNKLMLLIKDLCRNRNDEFYVKKTCEILGGCAFLWLRYHSLSCELYNETHIQPMLNSYSVHLESNTDESFLLKIITHTLYAFRKLPRIYYKILQKHLKRQVREVWEDPEVKEDQLYVLYIIAFKLWDILEPEWKLKINIKEYANYYMKPKESFLCNARYAPLVPRVTIEDVRSERATKIILTKIRFAEIFKLARAVVKEEWLNDSNEPITVDLTSDERVVLTIVIDDDEPDGVVERPDGVLERPDGVLENQDGVLERPDEVLENQDGVLESTSSPNAKKRCTSPNYIFIPTPE